MPRRKREPAKQNSDHYVELMLRRITEGKSLKHFTKGQTVFQQGDPADSIYFVETGRVKLTVVSQRGKEAVLAVLGPRGFLGEGCLVGQTLRLNAAIALDPSDLFCVETAAMTRALSGEHEIADSFIALLLARNIDMEADLCDQLFNHCEKRLARVLLKLARFGQPKTSPDLTIIKVNHDILAEMVGTTRPRITHFMNKFRSMGLIQYNGEIIVHADLLTDVVLHD